MMHYEITPLDEELIEAVERNDIDGVKSAMARGANASSYGDWALTSAAERGFADILKLLIENGVDACACRSEALFYAVKNGYRDAAFVLLRQGADPYAPHNEELNAYENIVFRNWLSHTRHQTVGYFSEGAPDAARYFTEGRLNDHVLDACVVGQFATLVATPLIASGSNGDRQLFADIWEALPVVWKNHYQNSYMQHVKQDKPYLARDSQSEWRISATSAVAMGRL
jgi:ankyrin repeat protein